MHPSLWVPSLWIAACTQTSTTTAPPATPPTHASAAAAPFPSGVALASPLAVEAAPARRAPGTSGYTTRFSWATDRIDDILAGEVPAAEAFTPASFLARPANAACFGPTLAYHDHPDGADGPPMGTWPQLPSGDLGLWLEVDPPSGDACAAAELTAQLDGVGGRAEAALMGVASLARAAADAGVALPSAGGAVDLTTDMNGLGVPGASFTVATLALDGAGARWTYELALTWVDDAGTPHDIAFDLTHEPSAIDHEYLGALGWQVDDQFVGGHCPSADVTWNGSLYYARADGLQVDARDGMYCGHGAPAATVVDLEVDPSGAYPLVDPSDTFTGAAGWANTFSVFGASFDPDTLAGDYTYAWQAGYGDGHTRIFSVGIESDAELVDGEAYYGFGDPIGTTDGSIHGLYCNWAGPGSTHTLQPYAQRQFVTFDSASGRFEVPAGGSDIVYAPTNDCTYTGAPAGFWYDRDLDGVEDEVSPDELEVHPSPTGAGLTLDLMAPRPADDLDGDGTATVAEAIANRGFDQPPM